MSQNWCWNWTPGRGLMGDEGCLRMDYFVFLCPLVPSIFLHKPLLVWLCMLPLCTMYVSCPRTHLCLLWSSLHYTITLAYIRLWLSSAAYILFYECTQSHTFRLCIILESRHSISNLLRRRSVLWHVYSACLQVWRYFVRGPHLSCKKDMWCID